MLEWPSRSCTTLLGGPCTFDDCEDTRRLAAHSRTNIDRCPSQTWRDCCHDRKSRQRVRRMLTAIDDATPFAPELDSLVTRTAPSWPSRSRPPRLVGVMPDVDPAVPQRARPTVSAISALRRPMSWGSPVVESTIVWCSISAFSSAPTVTAIAARYSHNSNTITAPNDP